MARDTSGPKNEPNYSGIGAPSDAADMTEIATYAARVGNRRADTSANRTAATGADLWEGLEWHETDTGLTYLYLSAAWVLSRYSSAAIPIVTFGTNWTGGTGGQTPFCYRQGNRVDLLGSAVIGASGGGGGYTNILTIPASCQPPTTTQRFVGATITSTGAIYHLGLTAGVLGSVSGYNVGSGAFSARIPLNFSWYLD
jgi:hypothetical protein